MFQTGGGSLPGSKPPALMDTATGNIVILNNGIMHITKQTNVKKIQYISFCASGIKSIYCLNKSYKNIQKFIHSEIYTNHCFLQQETLH